MDGRGGFSRRADAGLDVPWLPFKKAPEEEEVEEGTALLPVAVPLLVASPRSFAFPPLLLLLPVSFDFMLLSIAPRAETQLGIL